MMPPPFLGGEAWGRGDQGFLRDLLCVTYTLLDSVCQFLIPPLKKKMLSYAQAADGDLETHVQFRGRLKNTAPPQKVSRTAKMLRKEVTFWQQGNGRQALLYKKYKEGRQWDTGVANCGGRG